MLNLLYETIAGEKPQGKPNVFISYHMKDFGRYFYDYSSMILKAQDCAIWYEFKSNNDYDRNDVELLLSQMQLVVVLVTGNLLKTRNPAIDIEIPLALEKHIPILPLMIEDGLDEEFSARFGNLQYLDHHDNDKTRRNFDEVLETYFKSVLVGSELAKDIREAFNARIFLSYRKKDRRKAQELMRLIHRNPLFRDIAFWYDEFLSPGEDFNQAIKDMLKESDFVVMVVTPNLVNETNYIITDEYPEALSQKKPMLPVEMERTDRTSLEKHFFALPPCVSGEDENALHEAILAKIRDLTVTSNDKPDHNYLIGLAYLNGIDVEVDTERALELIIGAAESGLPEAMEQLAIMYETGKGVTRDFIEGIRWREKHVQYLRKAYETKKTEERAHDLISELWDLGDAQYALSMLNAAEKSYFEMYNLAIQYEKNRKSLNQRYIAVSCSKLGDIAKARGDLVGAQGYYEKALAIDKELSEKTGTNESRLDLSITYGRLGYTAKARGDLVGAQGYYEKALAIDKELSEKTRTIDSRRSLAISYIHLGDIAREMGDLPEAQRYYEKSLAIVEALWEGAKTVDSRNGLSVCYDRLGDIAKEMGDLLAAQRYYERSLAISEDLMEKTATIESWRSLSISYDRMGNIAAKRKDLEGAQRYYLKALTIREEIAKVGTIQSKSDLSISYVSLGDTAAARGDLAKAQEYYESAHAINKDLTEKAGTIEAWRFLSISYDRMGNIAEKRKDLEEAQRYYLKALTIREKIAKNTETIQSKEDLSISYAKMVDIATERGDLERAQQYLEKDLSINEELAKERKIIKIKEDLADIYTKLGDFAAERRDLVKAQMYYEKAYDIDKELSRNPGTIDSWRNLSIGYERFGKLAELKGDSEGAQRYYLKAVTVRERIVKKTESIQSKDDLLVCYVKLGDIAKEMGSLTKAQVYYEKSLAIAEELAEKTETLKARRGLSTVCFKLAAFYFNNKREMKKAKELFVRIVENGKDSNDEQLADQCRQAKSVLEKYFYYYCDSEMPLEVEDNEIVVVDKRNEQTTCNNYAAYKACLEEMMWQRYAEFWISAHGNADDRPGIGIMTGGDYAMMMYFAEGERIYVTVGDRSAKGSLPVSNGQYEVNAYQVVKKAQALKGLLDFYVRRALPDGIEWDMTQ